MNEASVTLSTYDWHLLLNDIEDHLRIVNRDRTTTRELYEKIASQLYGTKVTYILNEPQKPPKPDKEPSFFEKVSCWVRGKNPCKGGVNEKPKTPAPSPPKGQTLPPPPTRCIKEGVEIVKPKMPPLEYIKNRGLF